MNTLNLIEKLKSKVKETNEYIESTGSKQTNLLTSATELNSRLRNFIESDINEKKVSTESNEKMTKMKSRIEACKQNITNIKEKLKILKLKYQN